MSIPKILHYCWFGGAPKPKNIQNCIRSWKKYCPDYEIIEWNEQNFDVSQSLYPRQAYDARRWAFVADYARLKILYEQGGIYMDTDVELLRPLDDLLAYPAFFGFQHNNEVATGLGFGAEARSPVVKISVRSPGNAAITKRDIRQLLTSITVAAMPVTRSRSIGTLRLLTWRSLSKL